MIQNEQDIIEYISINDSLKLIDVSNIDLNGKIPVLIISSNTFTNYPNIDIKKLANRQYKLEEVLLMKSSPMNELTLNDVITLKKSYKEFLIVNKSFLTKLGFDQYILLSPNIYYFIKDSKKYLYFINESKLLMIESGNQMNLYSSINNNLNINIDINNIRKNIINCSVLLYANKKIINILYTSNLPHKYNIKDYRLINKSWLDNFKENYYNNFENIINTHSQIYQFNSYNDCIKNFKYFQSLVEIQNIANSINDIPVTLSQQIPFLPKIKSAIQNPDAKWPINFELVHVSLFNLFEKIISNKNYMYNNQPQYAIILGIKTLYLQSINFPIFFYIYEYDKNKPYDLLGIFRFESNSFQEQYQKYLNNITFSEYIRIRKLDINKISQTQYILNSNNQKIGELILIKQVNQINHNLTKSYNELGPMMNNQIFQNQNNIDQNSQMQEILNNLGTQNQNDSNSQIEEILNNLGTQNQNYPNNQIQQILNNPGTQNQNDPNSQIQQIFNNPVIQNQNDPNSQLQQIFNNPGIQNNLYIDPNNQFQQFLNVQGTQNKNNITDYSHHTFPQTETIKHYLGLENIGATCYMNATLQCLCHIKSFKKYFENENKINNDSQNRNPRLARCFNELIKNICHNTYIKSSYAPYNFKKLISELSPLFRGIQANDSKDLILLIFETLHNELNNPQSKEIIIDYLNSPNSQNISGDLKLFRNNYYSQNKSIISKIFYYEQISGIKCCSCGFDKPSYNIHSFLIFPLEKIRLLLVKNKPGGFEKVTIDDCFEQNEQPELLEGQNQIFCNNCRRSSNSLSYSKLYNCPEVLTIILNRGKGLEFNVEFEFSKHLHISKYVEDKSCSTNYQLIGVLTHLGPSGMSGHFIAYCKSPFDGNWYCYNDSQVKHCNDVISEINSNGIPYVLFYQKYKDPNQLNRTEKVNTKIYDGRTNEKKITLYFTYDEKGGFLDITRDKLFFEVKNELCNKYKWIPKESENYYKMESEKMTNIDFYKTISGNGIKNGDKICIIK